MMAARPIITCREAWFDFESGGKSVLRVSIDNRAGHLDFWAEVLPGAVVSFRRVGCIQDREIFEAAAVEKIGLPAGMSPEAARGMAPPFLLRGPLPLSSSGGVDVPSSRRHGPSEACANPSADPLFEVVCGLAQLVVVALQTGEIGWSALTERANAVMEQLSALTHRGAEEAP